MFVGISLRYSTDRTNKKAPYITDRNTELKSAHGTERKRVVISEALHSRQSAVIAYNWHAKIILCFVKLSEPVNLTTKLHYSLFH